MRIVKALNSIESWTMPQRILSPTHSIWLPRGWSGNQRQRLRDTLGPWDSLETPGEVAKLAPRDERLTGDAGSEVHLKDVPELGLKATIRMGLRSTQRVHIPG